MTGWSLFDLTSKRFLRETNSHTALVRRAALLIALAFALLASPWAGAQVLYDSLRGVVTDPSNAAIVGAKVQAIEINKGIRQEAVTESTGLYRFTEMLPGIWKITVSAPGFNSAETSDILVNANSSARVLTNPRPVGFRGAGNFCKLLI